MLWSQASVSAFFWGRSVGGCMESVGGAVGGEDRNGLCSCHPKPMTRVWENLNHHYPLHPCPRMPSSHPQVSISPLLSDPSSQCTPGLGAPPSLCLPCGCQCSVHKTEHPITLKTACSCLLIRLPLFALSITTD